MAGYYTLEEVKQKLGKTDSEVLEMVKQGSIREFRDGAKQLFKAEEVDQLAEDASVSSDEIDLSETTGSQSQSGVDFDINDLSDGDVSLSESAMSDLGAGQGDDIELVDDDESEKPAAGGKSDDELGLLDETKAAESDKPSRKEDPMDLSGEIKLEPSDTFNLAGDSDQDKGSDSKDNIAELTGADTSVGTTGINVLADTDDNYDLTSDGKSETKMIPSPDEEGDDLGDLDADLNMDSVGSGSGLLDLSLQADDTSLGAVLDDILPGGDEPDQGGAGLAAIEEETLTAGEEPGKTGPEGDMPLDQPDSSDQPLQDEIMPPAVGAGAVSGAPAVRYVELPPDGFSNACGVMAFIPLAALILMCLIVLGSMQGATPTLLTMVRSEMGGVPMIWYITGGMLLVSLIIVGVGAASGGGTSTSTKKKKEKKDKKPKKEKKAKEPKPKKKKK